MRIEHLELHSFRNIDSMLLAPQNASCIVLQGDNAQGKTNILEAMYMVATGRSFRHATSRQMLPHGATSGSIAATVSRTQVRHNVKVTLRPQGRSLEVDGRNVRLVTQLLDMVNLVAFFPDDLHIAKGSPEDRRRFLDRATANSQPAFVQATLNYHKILRSRNALFKDPRPPDAALVDTYDGQLVHCGVQMHRCRQAWLQQIIPVAQQYFLELMPSTRSVEVALHSGIGEAPACHPDELGEQFTAALRRNFHRDRARGLTSVGPHRADLLCCIDGADVRHFASQGQQRSLILALKLAEVICLQQRLGAPPILLLDDVSSELDAERTRRLFDVVKQVGSQVWVSTTGAVSLPVSHDAQRYRVLEGRLQAQF
jgi:DNA replication and repair protein RecF